MQTVWEPARQTTVHTSCDVLVVGGGTAGVVAALASARTGADTVLVEQYGYLGGTMHAGVCGVHSFFNNYQAYNRPKKQLVKGIPGEIADRMILRGACPGHLDAERGFEHFAVITAFSREDYKQLAFEMMQESGVRLFLHTYFSDVIRDEAGNPCGILIESKNGREAILAKQIVDTTGDGDVAFRAGVPLLPQTDPYNVGMLFAMAGVDVPRFAAFLEENHALESLACGDKGSQNDHFVRVATHFYRAPRLREMANQLGIWGVYTVSCHEGELTYINGSNTAPLTDFTPEEQTRAEIAARRNVMEMAQALRAHFPGFEKAYVSWTAAHAGIRRTRVIACEHDLSSTEIESGARFVDEIGLYGFHDLAPMRTIDHGGWYGIPYRALIPQKVDNLLVAGRMITSDKAAHMSTRNSACCMVQGQAAGTAAALCAQMHTSPRRLDPQVLRKQLQADGVCLD